MDNTQEYATVSLNTPYIELHTDGFPSHTSNNAELHLGVEMQILPPLIGACSLRREVRCQISSPFS